MIKSKHSADDPGILSLAFHPHSRTFFSGGTDTDITMWKLDSDKFTVLDRKAAGGSGGHSEGVCALEVRYVCVYIYIYICVCVCVCVCPSSVSISHSH